MLMPTCNGKTIPCFWGIKLRYTWVPSLRWEGPLEEDLAAHSSTLAWRAPWAEEAGRLQSTASQSYMTAHDRTTSHSTADNKDKPYYIYFCYYISTNTKENLEDKKLWCKGINTTLMTDRSRSPCWEGADTLPERGQGRVWCAATGVQFRMHTARLEQLEEKQWEGRGERSWLFIKYITFHLETMTCITVTRGDQR